MTNDSTDLEIHAGELVRISDLTSPTALQRNSRRPCSAP